MNILITGVTGFIGFHLARTFARQGHTIVAAARNPAMWQSKFPTYQWITCDYRKDTQTADWEPRMDGIDLVVNAVGIIHEDQIGDFETIQTKAPIALFTAANAKNIRIIQISAIGADDPHVKEKFLASKRKADQHLQQLNTESVICYPSIVIGRGGTSTALFNKMAASPVIPLIGNGKQKIQPLHIEDLCAQVAHLANHWPGGKQAYPLVGPNTLSMKELYELIRDWMRLKPAYYVAMPIFLLRGIAKVSETFGFKTMLTTESLDLLEKAKIYPSPKDVIQARPLATALWDEPATYADTWYARLMLVRPLLIATMAFVWIFTALTSAFFDLNSGYALLKSGGIEGILATLSIYCGAAVDFALGIGMLMQRYRLSAMKLQIALMLTYSVVISFIIPEQWLHPFGPVTKNFPMIAGTLLLIATDKLASLKFVKGV